MDQLRQTMHDSGFTLTEVLVAFVILSLSVILGLRAFGSGVFQVARVEEEFSNLRSMTETLAAAQLRESATNAPGNPDVVITPLTGEKSDWSSLVPHLVTVNRHDGKGDPFETIVIRRINNE